MVAKIKDNFLYLKKFVIKYTEITPNTIYKGLDRKCIFTGIKAASSGI